MLMEIIRGWHPAILRAGAGTTTDRQSGGFQRRSPHIVNLDFVKQLVPFDGSRMQIEMRDGTKILASRTRSKELRQLAI